MRWRSARGRPHPLLLLSRAQRTLRRRTRHLVNRVLGIVIVFAAVAAVCPAVASTAARPATPVPSPAYVVAAVPMSADAFNLRGSFGGISGPQLCIVPSCVWEASTNLSFLFPAFAFPSGPVGATSWLDSATPAFADVARAITDAVDGS